MTDEVEAMTEDGFERPLDHFLTGIGCCSARASPAGGIPASLGGPPAYPGSAASASR